MVGPRLFLGLVAGLIADAGHGIGNTKRQQFEELADWFAFLLWQMGVERYAPKH